MTTAIAYTSGKPHIGNTYEIVLADSIARFKRQQGYDVFFQTGTDEHGQKIELKAEEKGVTPKAFVDEVSTEIKRIWDLMNTSYDKFIRTTDADHEKQVQKIFKKLYDKGDIYKGHYEGMYCTPCESFFTESQLVDGKCPDCGREVQPAKEEAYFFRMSKYADRLIEHINTHPEFIQPVSRKNEMMNNFLLPGLQDLCVSRTSFKWGIPVDFDPKHVVYVWLDALTNYITGIGYDCDGNSSEQFKKDWPADLHLIGKDIIRFHTIYWPIFLMALDLPLPKQVFGHPWLLQGDGKMSKSKGNVLYADELVDFFGVDAVRYFVLHEMPFENDGVISWELMVERMNSDLANTLGNLVNRTVSMSNKYFGGVVENKNVNEPVDEELKKVVLETPNKVIAKMEEKSIKKYSLSEFARKVSIVHQHNSAAEDITIERLVSYGRTPYQKMLGGKSEEDERLIEQALQVTGLLDLRDREIGRLSGGQRQRVWIAMALAQNTELLFLDEPTTYLDIRYQLEILELVKKLNEEFDITIVMVLHDINQTIYFSDKIIGLQGGHVAIEGAPDQVITEESIQKLYGVHLMVTRVNGSPVVAIQDYRLPPREK